MGMPPIINSNIIYNDKNLIKRTDPLFLNDVDNHKKKLETIIKQNSILVLGGAGSIGSSTVKEILSFNPEALHIVDIDENGLANLIREIRSSDLKFTTDLKTFCLDIDSPEFDAFFENNNYDYVLNFSALKHVRSEKDPFTLMRMVVVNVLNTYKTLEQSIEKGVKKYFAVSTDKATNPVNLMGATKRVMEMFLMMMSEKINISTARFANVLFSNGSLPQSFLIKLNKRLPFSGPNDVKRYFITMEESGRLCLLSTFLGHNKEIFIPKIEKLKAIGFDEIAENILEAYGYKPYYCSSEEEAKSLIKELPEKGLWPCYFSPSDTTGEKDIEEFFTKNDTLDTLRFRDIAVIQNKTAYDKNVLQNFLQDIKKMRENKNWTKENIVHLIADVLKDEFSYEDKKKYLDEKM